MDQLDAWAHVPEVVGARLAVARADYGVGRLTWECLTQPAVVSGVVARAARSARPHLIAARAS